MESQGFSFYGNSRILFLYSSRPTNFPGALVSPFFNFFFQANSKSDRLIVGSFVIPSLARLSLNALSQTYCFVNVLEEVGPTNFFLVKTWVSIGPNPRIGRRRYIPFYLLWFYLYTISKTKAWKKQGHLLTNIMGRDLTLPVIFYFYPCKDTLRLVWLWSVHQPTSPAMLPEDKPQYPRYMVTSGGTNPSVGQ